MFSLETSLLGVALALDAAVVSFAVGLVQAELSKAERIKRATLTAGLFGFFQFLMVWIGSKGGYYLSFSDYGYLFGFIVAAVFIVIGIKVLQDSFKKEDKIVVDWGLIPMVLMALATSIDALAAGISIGTLPMAWMSSIEIGIITFIFCFTIYHSTTWLKDLPDRWMLRFAASIFLFLGGRIIAGYFA